MPLTIHPVVKPFRGYRGTDAYGSGVYGASRDNGSRDHLGIDLLAVVGDEVVSPFPGTVVHVGIAYPGATLGSVHVQGDGEFSTWRAKLLYVQPDPMLSGRYVGAGDRLGVAQDVSAYWFAKMPRSSPMKNHIHLEIEVTEPRKIDGALYMPHGLVAVPVTA